jgi:coproporphyrinogen III oxidase-like Fe-S oxidoreductase
VLNLRTRDGIDLARFQTATGVDFREVFSDPIQQYERQGMIEVTSNKIRLTREALAVADPILCDFSAL